MSANPRRLVLRGLARLERNQYAAGQSVLRGLLDGPDARDLDPRDRGLVTELFYGVLRWRLRLDAVIGRFARKGVPKDPELANILRLGAYQLLLLDRVPDRAAVHTAVSLAKKMRGPQVSSFVNGVLRAIARDTSEPDTLAERWAHPQWMIDRFREEVGEEALEARLRANMTPPPQDLRLHPTEEGPLPTEPDAIRAGIRALRWIPQDPASQRVVELLDPQPGDRVLELCAGRGVKSTQLADAVGPTGSVLSVDASAPRLAEAARLLQRWAPEVPWQGICADGSEPLPLDPDLRFDKILVDAPCSGLGVIRRRPETLWRRQPNDVANLAALQKRILKGALSRLTPDGTLVYAVCTTTPEETVQVTGPQTGQTFQTTPETDQTDGFYATRLTRG
ncbi:MAG: 16S rRNA (cytosine967-C5)-methyltransferase [Myxococcota bacterium]|jgi:16S rRNA (cytosine967-C5)-methyltransferase